MVILLSVRGGTDRVKWLNKLWRILEEGHAKMTYTDLYSKGAMTQEDYLKLIQKIEEDEDE